MFNQWIWKFTLQLLTTLKNKGVIYKPRFLVIVTIAALVWKVGWICPRSSGCTGKIFGVHGLQHTIFYPRGGVNIYILGMHISTNLNTRCKYNVIFYNFAKLSNSFLCLAVLNGCTLAHLQTYQSNAWGGNTIAKLIF